jgi:hypothetical protein
LQDSCNDVAVEKFIVFFHANATKVLQEPEDVSKERVLNFSSQL